MGDGKAPSKEIRELLRKCENQGCEVERLGSGHFRVSKPGNLPTVTISGTRVAHRTFQKQKSLIKRLLGVTL